MVEKGTPRSGGHCRLLLRIGFSCGFLGFFLLPLLGCHPQGNALKKAQASFKLGDYERAARFFEAALDEEPLSLPGRYGHALTLMELALAKKRDRRDSLRDWREVASAYEICLKVDTARARLPASLPHNYAQALFHLANRLYQRGSYGEALERIAVARAQKPKDIYILNLQGILEYSLGRYTDAAETFEFLLAVDPKFTSAYLNLGNVLWEAGKEDEALATWKQGLGMSPGNEALGQRVEVALGELGGR